MFHSVTQITFKQVLNHSLGILYALYLVLQDTPCLESDFCPQFTSTQTDSTDRPPQENGDNDDPRPSTTEAVRNLTEESEPMTTQDQAILKLLEKRRQIKEGAVKLRIAEVTIVNEETSFMIQTQADDKENFDVHVYDPNSEEVAAQPRLLTNGDISVSFTPVCPGSHYIHVFHKNEPVPGCPVACKVYDPSKLIITGVEEYTGAVGDIIQLSLDSHLTGLAVLGVDGLCPMGQHLPIKTRVVPHYSNKYDFTELEFSTAITGEYKLYLTYGGDGVKVPQAPLLFTIHDRNKSFSAVEKPVFECGKVDYFSVTDSEGVGGGTSVNPATSSVEMDQEPNKAVTINEIPPTTVEMDVGDQITKSIGPRRKMTWRENQIRFIEENELDLVPYERLRLNNLREQEEFQKERTAVEDNMEGDLDEVVCKLVEKVEQPRIGGSHDSSSLDADSEDGGDDGGMFDKAENIEDITTGTEFKVEELDEDDLAERYPNHYEEILNLPRRKTPIFKLQTKDKMVRSKNPRLIETLRCSNHPEKAINMMNITQTEYQEMFGVEVKAAATAYSVGDQREDRLDEMLRLVTSPKSIDKLGTMWNKLARFEKNYKEFRLVFSMLEKISLKMCFQF